MTRRSIERISAICVLVAAFVAANSEASIDECRPLDELRPGADMRVFPEDTKLQHDARSLDDQIWRQSWTLGELLQQDELLLRAVAHFARAAKDETLAGGLKAGQFLDMNRYRVGSDCERSKLSERYEFCAQLRSRGDKLKLNLFSYCRAMAKRVDECCTLQEVNEAERRLAADVSRVRLAADELDSIREEARREFGAPLESGAAYRGYLAGIDRKSAEELRQSCARIFAELRPLLSVAVRDVDFWFDDVLEQCSMFEEQI